MKPLTIIIVIYFCSSNQYSIILFYLLIRVPKVTLCSYVPLQPTSTLFGPKQTHIHSIDHVTTYFAPISLHTINRSSHSFEVHIILKSRSAFRFLDYFLYRLFVGYLGDQMSQSILSQLVVTVSPKHVELIFTNKYEN